MGRGKESQSQKKKSKNYDSESDEDDTGHTQLSQSINKEELNNRVSDLVQYLLIADQKKIPIKKQDINKNVLERFSKNFDVIMGQAKVKLREVFGIDVVECDEKTKAYMLVSAHEMDSDHPHLSLMPEDKAKSGLIIVILSLIFMNGNVMPDTILWATLKRMGIEVDKHHDVFGDTKKLITQEFVRQRYITYTKQLTGDPPSYELKWGSRAYCETTRRRILEFVCRMYDNKVENWKSQYQEVLESEAANGDVANGQA